jgi:hypothetical protein
MASAADKSLIPCASHATDISADGTPQSVSVPPIAISVMSDRHERQ